VIVVTLMEVAPGSGNGKAASDIGAPQKAWRQGVEKICLFCTHTDERADANVSVDSFEHYMDPASVFMKMYELLNWEGAVFASFGPIWYHSLARAPLLRLSLGTPDFF
jgi:hypothetical protein